MKSSALLLCATAALLLVLTDCLSSPERTPLPTPRHPTLTPARTATTTQVDDETLNRLTLGLGRTVDMQPGESRQFSLGTIECCVVFQPVAASAEWSASPTLGAQIDPHSGLFRVDATAQSGSVFTISANVENGRRVVSAKVYVFTPQSNPLAQWMWVEEAQFECGSGKVVIPPQLIRELRFDVDGSFSVTWVPFDVYRDYWGSYAYDLDRGTIQLVVTRGNYIPKDVDGSGRFSIDDQGRLSLEEMWLGCPRDSKTPPNCGHRFVLLR